MACVYERALAAFPVTHYLWLAYGRFMEGARPGNVQALYRRAVRNCPWVGALWSRQALLLCSTFTCLRRHICSVSRR